MANEDHGGLSQVRLAAIDRFIREKYVDPGWMPGALLQVWRGGKLAHQGMSGMMDVAAAKPMRADVVFRIYSMTKPIMGAALLALIEEGKIALADKVTDYIPSWGSLKVLEDGKLVPPHRQMTVLDLARHTSGLSGAGDTPVHEMYKARRIAARDLEGGLDRLIEMLAELPLEFHPGEGLTYSIGATVLGYVMQQASGRTLGEVLRTRILDPLGMDETSFQLAAGKADRLAAVYRWNPGASSLDPDLTQDFTRPALLESGDGGLVSTAADYMRFCRMLLGGGSLDGVRVLSPKSVALMGTNLLPGGRDWTEMAGVNRLPGWIGDGIGVSLCTGTTIDVARRMMPASAGDIFWSGAAATYMLVDRAEDLAVVFLTQALGTPFLHDLQRRLYTMIYGAMTESRS
jgi:CubicO group peptidase (beta-lactamase class C family)